MLKVAIVGHSQVPRNLNVNNVDVKIFRAPGGRISSFHSDERVNAVLSWEHNLTFVWLGSKDVVNSSILCELATGNFQVLQV